MHSLATRQTSTVEQRFQNGIFALREQADARIFWLLIAQWAVTLISSFAMAARWKMTQLGSLSTAVIWVGVLSVIPLAMVIRSPGMWQSRWSVVVSQSLMSTLLWSVSGGRPDSHLHLFAWLVVLALYRDVSALLATMVFAVAAHTVLVFSGAFPVAMFEPADGFTNLVWMAWLGGETIFLSTFVLLDRQAISSQVEREYALEVLQAEYHAKVEEITESLAKERDALHAEIASLQENQRALESTQSDACREHMSLRRDIATHSAAIVKLASRPCDSTVTKAWRSQWQTLRQQAQHLLRLVEVPTLSDLSRELSSRDSNDSSSNVRLSQKQEMDLSNSDERRAMLMMRNPLQQAKAVSALEAEGYRVDVVANGPKTYYSVMLTAYSVIVVDIDLPGEEGFDTLEALQLLPPSKDGKSRRLLAVTSDLTPDRVLRCADLGVDGILQKPLRAEELRKNLRDHSPVRPARSAYKPLRSDSCSAVRSST